MMDDIVVFIIVAVAVFILGRRIYLTMSGKDTSSGCARCANSLANVSDKEESCCSVHKDAGGE